MSGAYILILSFLFTNLAWTQSKDYGNPVHDLVPINGDTLIVAKWHGGLMITYDAGKTWNVLSPDILFKTITVDNKGVLWGLDSWRGIHEREYSHLFKSTDKGKTWKKTVFDTKTFFPLEIISKPHAPLRIITIENKDYALSGRNPLVDWKYISTHLEQENEIREGRFKILNSGREGVLLKLTSRCDTVYTFKGLHAFDLHIKKDTVFVAGDVGGSVKAYFGYLTKNTKIKEFQIDGMQAYGIREDRKGRIWMFSTEGVYLLNNDKLEKPY